MIIRELPSSGRAVSPLQEETSLGDSGPSVIAADGIVRIVDLVEEDPRVFEVASTSSDPLNAVHDMLRIGAHAVSLASISVDTDIVGERFSTMSEDFERTIADAIEQVSQRTDSLLNENDGVLTLVLRGLHSDLDHMLSDTFDPESKRSAIAKVEDVMLRVSEQLVKSLRGSFSLDQPDSPLARTKRDMVQAIKDETSNLMEEIRHVRLALAGNEAASRVAEKLTSKGFAFEDLLLNELQTVGTPHGDIVEVVGKSIGSTGRMKGDVLVTLCAEDTAGARCSFVVEAKAQKLSMTKSLAELDAAVRNHDAQAGLAIFAEASGSPISGPFWFSGNRAIVVFDKHDPDPRVLVLAYEWARWVARRSLVAESGRSLNIEQVHEAITKARQAMRRHQTIKSCHTTIRNKAEEARIQVAELVDEVDEAISDLLALLTAAQEAA